MPSLIADPFHVEPMGAWADQAACKGYRHQHGDDAWRRVWFPEPGRHAYNAALKVCAGCPVRGDCADWALTNRIEHGVWGGMTRADRQEYWRKRAKAGRPVRKPRPRPPHGSPAGYQWEIRNLGWTCEECRHSRLEYVRERRGSRAKVKP